jgi:hypothetical protein
MAIVVGPSDWWLATPDAINSLVIACPEGTILPDGSGIIYKQGGTAYIATPFSTQVGQTWNNSTTTLVGNKPLACDWPTLCTKLIECGFNPNDWCVLTQSELFTYGYTCRSKWPGSFSSTGYWSSTEASSTSACGVNFAIGNQFTLSKTNTYCVRAFRRVTY